MNLDEYEAEIDSTKARLEMVDGGNPQILHEFEKRAGDIEKAKYKLEKIENDLLELQQNINEVRQKWEPELDQLIGQISDAFSDNFAKINCAGQVEVYKEDDDFNKWAIQIQVKFRYATLIFTILMSITLTMTSQRERTTVRPRLASPIWWRTCCVDNLLSHGVTESSPSPLPCC
jgi:hypothetical protein